MLFRSCEEQCHTLEDMLIEVFLPHFTNLSISTVNLTRLVAYLIIICDNRDTSFQQLILC
jgi:hypothetical protein